MSSLKRGSAGKWLIMCLLIYEREQRSCHYHSCCHGLIILNQGRGGYCIGFSNGMSPHKTSLPVTSAGTASTECPVESVYKIVKTVVMLWIKQSCCAPLNTISVLREVCLEFDLLSLPPFYCVACGCSKGLQLRPETWKSTAVQWKLLTVKTDKLCGEGEGSEDNPFLISCLERRDNSEWWLRKARFRDSLRFESGSALIQLHYFWQSLILLMPQFLSLRWGCCGFKVSKV